MCGAEETSTSDRHSPAEIELLLSLRGSAAASGTVAPTLGNPENSASLAPPRQNQRPAARSPLPPVAGVSLSGLAGVRSFASSQQQQPPSPQQPQQPPQYYYYPSTAPSQQHLQVSHTSTQRHPSPSTFETYSATSPHCVPTHARGLSSSVSAESIWHQGASQPQQSFESVLQKRTRRDDLLYRNPHQEMRSYEPHHPYQQPQQSVAQSMAGMPPHQLAYQHQQNMANAQAAALSSQSQCHHSSRQQSSEARSTSIAERLAAYRRQYPADLYDLDQAMFAELGPTPKKALHWVGMLAELLEYRAKFQHCRVTATKCDNNRSLHNWVNWQRQEEVRGHLSAPRYRLLKRVGFLFSLPSTRPGGPNQRWSSSYARLVEFHRKFGHCDVPEDHEEYAHLASWCARQLYHKRRLSQQRRELLDRVGFVWSRSRSGKHKSSKTHLSSSSCESEEDSLSSDAAPNKLARF